MPPKLALIYNTDQTSSILLMLDAHTGEAGILAPKLQLHPIHLLVNYHGESGY